MKNVMGDRWQREEEGERKNMPNRCEVCRQKEAWLILKRLKRQFALGDSEWHVASSHMFSGSILTHLITGAVIVDNGKHMAGPMIALMQRCWEPSGPALLG